MSSTLFIFNIFHFSPHTHFLFRSWVYEAYILNSWFNIQSCPFYHLRCFPFLFLEFSSDYDSHFPASFLKRFYLFFREGKGKETEGEKHQCVVASHTLLTGDLAHSPGTCPDWESNQRPFGSQAGAHSTEPHQPGLLLLFIPRKFLLDATYCIFVVAES